MSRPILLREHHLLRFSVFCLPLLDPALQRSQLALLEGPFLLTAQMPSSPLAAAIVSVFSFFFNFTSLRTC